MKEELGWENDSDGIFWIDYDDYLRIFSSTEVAFWYEYTHYESYNLKLEAYWYDIAHAIEIPEA